MTQTPEPMLTVTYEVPLSECKRAAESLARHPVLAFPLVTSVRDQLADAYRKWEQENQRYAVELSWDNWCVMDTQAEEVAGERFAAIFSASHHPNPKESTRAEPRKDQRLMPDLTTLVEAATAGVRWAEHDHVPRPCCVEAVVGAALATLSDNELLNNRGEVVRAELVTIGRHQFDYYWLTPVGGSRTSDVPGPDYCCEEHFPSQIDTPEEQAEHVCPACSWSPIEDGSITEKEPVCSECNGEGGGPGWPQDDSWCRTCKGSGNP